MNALTVNSNGIPFNIKLVNEGEQYGLNNRLTHDKEDPLVEFYDARFPHTDLGQFVTRYSLSTLTEDGKKGGLNLQGGIPDWYVSEEAMNQVRDWLKSINSPSNGNAKKLKF